MSEAHKFTFEGYPAVKLNGVPYVRADSLEAMGYVKVVRCRECKWWWADDESPVHTQHLCRNLSSSNNRWLRGEAHYCPEGEPKEDPS